MNSKIADPIISIITPTYNRASLLQRCYESLREQTDKRFEWIVIDDGSRDNTKEVMNKILEEDNLFDIKFVTKVNGGKHTALNAAHSYIKGKYILILDSDDYLTKDAVETAVSEWNHYRVIPEVGMLIFQRENTQKVACAYGAIERQPVHLLTCKRVSVLSSDCIEVLKTELFLKYPFPTFGKERFLAETALWNRVAMDCKCVYINKPIYVCEYLEGGLTKSGRKMRTKNPLGGMYTSYLRMNKICSLKSRIKAGLLFVIYGKYAHLRNKKILKKAKPYQRLVAVCMIPGNILYLRWKKKY